MSKPFDSTTKQLIEAHPEDWLVLAGLPLAPDIAVVEADLSSFSAAADKVIRVGGASPYIAHFELQASLDVTMDRRMLLYNVLLRWRHNLPVRSVVVLLRPAAASPSILGQVNDQISSEHLLEFRYKIVRVWETSPESLLGGGPGTLPLAPISSVTTDALAGVVQKMEDRIGLMAPGEAKDLETAAYILLGLRFRTEMIKHILAGVQRMEESVTYQEIIQKGEVRGKVQGERALMIRLGTKKFGPPAPKALQYLNDISDIGRIEELSERLFSASSWDELLG